MGKTAAEMRFEIEQKRSDLSYDLGAIEDRVSPSRVARRRTESIRSRLVGVRDAVMGRVEDTSESARNVAGSASEAPHQLTRATRGNPIAAGVVAFGLGMLTAAVLPDTPTERELADSMRPQLDRAKDTIASSLRDDAHDVAENVRPTVEGNLDELQSAASESASRVQESVHR